MHSVLLVECWANVWSLICAYICTSVDSDIHATTDDKAMSTTAACSIVGILIDNNLPQASEKLRVGECYTITLVTISVAVMCICRSFSNESIGAATEAQQGDNSQ